MPTAQTHSAPRLCRHTGQSTPTPGSDFGAGVTELRLQTTTGISGDNAEGEEPTQSPEEWQPPVPCSSGGTLC